MASSSDIPDLTGQVVGGKYRVDRLIGTGGMGTVWEGVHEALGHKVAIKFIKPQYASLPDARRRFEIEARAAARLKTKHAVQVYDFGVTDDGIPYIVMEYLEGRSLSELLMDKGPLPGAEVGLIISQAARALGKAHAAGIVHRDLKPDNIFLATNAEEVGAEGYSVKLVDFGIAKIVDPLESTAPSRMGGPTQEGAVVGTPNFMSPEQLTVGGAPGPLTDIWSLGACAFTAMTARIPFDGDVLGDIVLKVCVSPLPVPSNYNPRTPSGFDAWFAKACSRDATRRFQTANELRESIELVCGVTDGRAPAPSLEDAEVQYELRPAQPPTFLAVEDEDLEMPSRMSPRTALLAGLVIGVAVMIGIIGAVAWRQQQPDDDSAQGSASASAASPHAPPPAISAPPSPSDSAKSAPRSGAGGHP
jgi:serine/threonine-protein kinase